MEEELKKKFEEIRKICKEKSIKLTQKESLTALGFEDKKRQFPDIASPILQVCDRKFAIVSLSEWYNADLEEAGLVEELISSFKDIDTEEKETDLKTIFGNDWKQKKDDVLTYIAECKRADSLKQLCQDKIYERNYDNEYLQYFIGIMSKLNEEVDEKGDTATLRFKRFKIKLLMNCEIGQRGISKQAFYDARLLAVHLNYDSVDEQYRRQEQKKYRLQKELEQGNS